MASESREKPGVTAAASRRQERQARLAEALRDNLRKRKAQQRDRGQAKDKPSRA